jgi:predicted dehydrogenase
VRVLVVGVGSIGRRHATNLVRLGAGAVAVCDRDGTAVAAVTATLGVKGHTDLRDALAEDPHAVLVCTPTDQHVDVAHAALDAGAHVFIEKPLGLDLSGVVALGAAARARDRLVKVACNMRFHPGVATLRAALAEGMIGRPLLFRASFSHYLPNWRPDRDYRATYSARRAEGGGMLLEGVHEIDYVRWLGGEITAVTAWAARLGGLDIDAEDCASVQLMLAGGAAGVIELDCLGATKRRGCEIIGSRGVLRWTSEGKAPEVVTVRLETSQERRVLAQMDGYDGNAMYVEELEWFLRAIRGEATPLATLEDGARVLELALRARAIAEARP